MGVFQDIKYGVRMLAKNRTFTLAAVLALAVGIGLNAAVFTLVNAVLVKGLPFEDPDRIVHITSRNIPAGRERMSVSYADFEDWREQSRSFKGLAAHRNGSLNLSDDKQFPERASGAWMTPNAFALIGQQPLIGRDFMQADAEPGGEKIIIIGYAVWQNRYGGDPGVLGSTIKASDVAYTIIGVMPQGMEFPNNNDLWMPLIPSESDQQRSSNRFRVFARLDDGVSIAQAQAEMDSITGRLAEEYADTNEDRDVLVMTSSQAYNGGPIQVVFLALMGSVTFVLLIACANVANLLLSQAFNRSRETSIRTALGAGRWRVVRQLLLESLMLSVLGASLDLLLAIGGVRLFDIAVADVGKPYWIDFSMDFTVFAYLGLICVGTAVLFGLVPALQASRTDINDSLKSGGRSSMGGVRSRKLIGGLVVAELGLTLILLVGAGLMMRSFMNLNQIDLGIDAADALTLQLALPEAKYGEVDERLAFQDRVLERMSAIPGIEHVALTSNLPSEGSMQYAMALPDRDLTDAEGELPVVAVVAVTPDYFKALGRDVVRGRGFTAADGIEGAEVAIVNERFAARYWPGEDPIGHQMRLGKDSEQPWVTIVGIAPPIRQRVRQSQEVAEIEPTAFVPFRQESVRGIDIVARSQMGPEPLADAIRTEIRAIDPDLPTYSVQTFEEMIYEEAWPYRVFGSIFGILAVVALVLSSVGIFGVTSYSVSQRTQEIGMRMALGAAARDVLWLVAKQGLKQLSVGLLLGLAGAFAVTRVIGDLMFGVRPTDPFTFIAITVILSLVTLSACFVPARRATQLDPMRALRID